MPYLLFYVFSEAWLRAVLSRLCRGNPRSPADLMSSPLGSPSRTPPVLWHGTRHSCSIWDLTSGVTLTQVAGIRLSPRMSLAWYSSLSKVCNRTQQLRKRTQEQTNGPAVSALQGGTMGFPHPSLTYWWHENQERCHLFHLQARTEVISLAKANEPEQSLLASAYLKINILRKKAILKTRLHQSFKRWRKCQEMVLRCEQWAPELVHPACSNLHLHCQHVQCVHQAPFCLGSSWMRSRKPQPLWGSTRCWSLTVMSPHSPGSGEVCHCDSAMTFVPWSPGSGRHWFPADRLVVVVIHSDLQEKLFLGRAKLLFALGLFVSSYLELNGLFALKWVEHSVPSLP